MKLLSERKGFKILAGIREEFRRVISENYEDKASPCSACMTPGACCRDEHFVNVHITRLEAGAIAERLEELGEEKRNEVLGRISSTIMTYGLDGPGDSFAMTFACPLYEIEAGCLVHDTAKPLPCIAHACYENKSDLPPDELLAGTEEKVHELNRKVYGKPTAFEPIPVAIRRRMAKFLDP